MDGGAARKYASDVLSGAEGLPDAALEWLGIAEDPLDLGGPGLFARALGSAAVSALKNPAQLAMASVRFTSGAASATAAATSRAIGRAAAGPMPLPERDPRFADPTWDRNAAYYLLRQLYLLQSQLIRDIVDAASLDDATAKRAQFGAAFLTDALAPTNTLLGNPDAMQHAFRTGGLSLVRGARQMLHDLRRNSGWPSQVDRSEFEVGRNLAATPGKVVYRGDLFELIQYEPRTDDVFGVPLLFCPPWINKYYIMDLSAGRSLVEWAVDHGHTCFAISYRNPGPSMRDATFDDYLLNGPLTALEVVKTITGSEVVNTLSVCLGGTLTAMLLAYNARRGDDSVNSATLINTHTDFTDPGILGVFSDEAATASLEKRMQKRGYLGASEMARTFSAIRANDLIFQYVVNNWLKGEKPPSFDLLSWNEDSTRLPARLYSQYLRSCYLRNEFARGEFVVNGEKVDPNDAKTEAYVVAAIDDHIVPWRSAYKTTQLLGGTNRFVLSTSGHIAAIVNPPSPKAKHWTFDETPADPDEWLANAALHSRTWWDDWATWIAQRSGPRVAPRTQLGCTEYPPLGDAPGLYVLET